MKPYEMPHFSKLMTQLAVVYSKPMDPVLIEIYWQALKAFDFKAVEAAMLAHIGNPDVGQFMPKPADVVRFLKGSSQTQALQAWSLVLKTIQRVGHYPTVVFDDPLIHAVISDMGGWIALCKLLEEDTPFRAKEFENRYVGFLLQPPKTYPKQLSGTLEQENSAKGYPIDPPMLIGDIQNALKVYQGGSQQLLPCYQPETPLPQSIKSLTVSLELPIPTKLKETKK